MADLTGQSPGGVPLRSPLQVDIEWSGAAGQALLKAVERLREVTPILPTIGRKVVNSQRRNILEQRTPDGKAWRPLKRDRGPGRNPDRRALFDSGHLYESITYRLGPDYVEVGVFDVPYAKFHNQGVNHSWTIRARHTTKGGKPGMLRFWNGEGWSFRREVRHPGLPARTFVGIREGDVPDFRLIIRGQVEAAFEKAAAEAIA